MPCDLSPSSLASEPFPSSLAPDPSTASLAPEPFPSSLAPYSSTTSLTDGGQGRTSDRRLTARALLLSDLPLSKSKIDGIESSLRVR